MTDDRKPIALCRPCKQEMETIVNEQLGEAYWCRSCGHTVEISHSSPSIVIDVMGDRNPGTTLNGGARAEH